MKYTFTRILNVKVVEWSYSSEICTKWEKRVKYKNVWKCLVIPNTNVNATEFNGIRYNGLSKWSVFQNI